MDAYLDRIGLTGPLPANLETLEALQRSHLSSVPFENLDVYSRRGVRTDDAWSLAKIVDRRRGGWCFELNGAFAALLAALGYEVRRLAASVLYEGSAPFPTHLTVAVFLDRPYLVDVGFGDSFIRPLPLDTAGPHDGGNGEYGFVFENGLTTMVSLEGPKPISHYRFDMSPHTPGDFDSASEYLQTEPGLHWTRSRFATRLIDGGPDRVTLLSDRIKLRTAGQWTEHPVEESEWAEVLSDWFDLTP